MSISQIVVKLLFIGVFQHVVATTTVKVGVLLMSEVPWPWDVRRLGPAIEIGVEHAKNVYDIDIQLEYHTYPGECPLEASIGEYEIRKILLTQLLNLKL